MSTHAPTPVVIVDTPEDVGRLAADAVFAAIVAAERDGRTCVIGCPGGRSPRSTYEALSLLVATSHQSLSHVVIAMMDEYVEQDEHGEFRNVSADQHYSCRGFAEREILGPLNAAAGPGRGIDDTRLWVPDAHDPSSYERRLQDAGVDVFLLATGASDGHIAFNPPGTDRQARTRVVELADSTRTDNLGTFPEFRSLDEVPSYGVTVGCGTIADVSRSAILVITGSHKHEAVMKLREATSYDPMWPSTIALECASTQIIVDRGAAG